MQEIAQIGEVMLNEVTLGLIQDLRDLRAARITNADARTRAQLAREILRSVHLSLEGMKAIRAANTKQIDNGAIK